MRIDDFDKPLNEAMPMSGIQSLGQKLRSQLPTFDPTGAAQAKGKLESGKLANELTLGYNQFLGQLRQQPTASNLLQYLAKVGYPTKNAIVDLKKNVKLPTTPQPGQQIKEKVATPTNEELSLLPKDLALDPIEPTAPRRDITNAPTTPAKPAPAGSAPVANQPAQKQSIAQVPLNKNQISSALIASATEYFANAGTTQPSTSQPAASSQQTSRPANSPQSTPSAAQSFAAGLTGKSMPGNKSSTTQINFSDANSVNNVIQQMNKFRQSGGKLDPNTKSTLQKLINQL
jgi:hypothetical protein